MQVLEIENNLVVGIFDTDSIETVQNITKNKLIAAEGDIPHGSDLRFFEIFEDRIIPKTPEKLLEEKLITLGKDEVIENGIIRKLTKKEQYEKGLINIDNNFKFYDDENLIEKTPLEKYKDKLISTIDFFFHVQDITSHIAIQKKIELQNLINQKRDFEELEIWYPENEKELLDKADSYKKLVEEFKEKKKTLQSLKKNEDIMTYYEKVLIPRLEELI